MKSSGQKVVAVTYESWSLFYRMFHSRILTEKILAFWIGGRLWQVMVSPGGMFDCSQIKKVTEYKRISE